jgi:hypothetical protein
MRNQRFFQSVAEGISEHFVPMTACLRTGGIRNAVCYGGTLGTGVRHDVKVFE